MQPTVIKIKFTPIIKHLQTDNTKCCLEVVPDVSCIQNLDTVEWNDENKLLEYNVPVNYKIILKRDTDQNIVEKHEKIYYSCIDLRLLSTNSIIGCGDINKVISDNYIKSKVTTEFASSITTNNGSRKPNDIKKDVCLKVQHSVNETEELNRCFNPFDIDKGDDDGINTNNIRFPPNVRCLNIEEDKKPIRQIYTECTMSKETITDISGVRSNNEKKLKLTITSVCTLNTLDNPIYDEYMKNNSTPRLKYKPKNKTDYNISEISESFLIHNSIYCEDNKLLIKNVRRERILPQLRVAHFMMSVENEILPLKILLSEIYRKCASLGLLRKSTVLPESAPEFLPKYTNKIKFLKYKEKIPKCNRVVYSIVFEE